MPVEFLNSLTTLGIGGVIAAIAFYFLMQEIKARREDNERHHTERLQSSEDRQDDLSSYAQRLEGLVKDNQSVIEANTKAQTANAQALNEITGTVKEFIGSQNAQVLSEIADLKSKLDG